MNALKNERRSSLSERIARFRRALSEPRSPTDIELIRASGLFDAQWYLQKYPDVAKAGVDPLSHYMTHGAREGRKASARFDARWYVNTYPDAAASDTHPLLHYIHNRQGRVGTLSDVKALTPEQKSDATLLLASAHFDAAWYAETNGLGKAGRQAALHYLQFGAAKGSAPSPSFDGDRYLTAYPDIREAGANPLIHYIRHGEREGRRAFALDDPGPAVLSFAAEASNAHPTHPVTWTAASQLVGETTSVILTLGKQPAGLIARHAAGSGLPRRLGHAAEIFCRVGGRAADNLAGIKGSRKRVKLIAGGAPDLNALHAPVDDAWFVSDNLLTLRLKALRGGQSVTGHVLRAFQFVAQGNRLAPVGEAWVSAQGGLVALALENPFQPVLCVVCSRAGEVLDGFVLAFPSLYRGGAHAAELQLLGRGSQASSRIRDYSRVLTQELLGWPDAPPSVLSEIQVDLRGATGNERIFGQNARTWLAEAGVAVTPSNAQALDASVQSYLVAAVTLEPRHSRGGQAVLRFSADALPSLSVMISRRMTDGAGSYVVCAEEAAEPRLSVSLPPMSQSFASLQPVNLSQPYPSLSLTGEAVQKLQTRSRLLAIRFMQDSALSPPALAFPVDESVVPPVLQIGALSLPSRERITAVIRVSSPNSLRPLLRSLARQTLASRLDVLLAIDSDIEVPADLDDAFSGTLLRIDCPRGMTPSAALNYAVEEVSTPWMLLLDQHVVLHDFRTLETMRTLATYRRAATASCMRICQSGFRDGAPLTFHSAGIFPSHIDLLASPSLAFATPVTTAAFPCMTYPVVANGLEFALVSRKAWDEIGGLDDDAYPFDGYGLDFCLKAIRAGWTHLNTTGISALDTVRRPPERTDVLGADMVSMEEWGQILARTAQIRRLN